MPELEKDTVALLVYLLPGFLSSWLFYGLTSHTKPSQFERVIQALIFTYIIQALVPVMKSFLCLLGRFIVIRAWDHTSEIYTSLILALTLGVLLAYYTNSDSLHKWLRTKNFTTRTSHPSEWFGVFSERVTYVVLHMNDERRLYGWPKEWPTESDKGYFYIMQPIWLNDSSEIELINVDGILISAKDVKWVEFMTTVEENTK